MIDSNKPEDFAEVARLKSYKLDPLWNILKEMNVQGELIDALKNQISEGVSYKATIEDLKDKVDRLESDISGLVNRLESDISGLTDRLQGVKGEAADPLIAEIPKLKSQLEENIAEIPKLKSQLEENSGQISHLQKVLEQTNLSEVRNAVNEHGKRLGDLTQKLEKVSVSWPPKGTQGLRKTGIMNLFIFILLAVALGVGSFFQYQTNNRVEGEIGRLELASNKTTESLESFNESLKSIDALRKDISNSGATINEYIPKMASLEEGLRSREREIRNISIHAGTLQDVLERLESDLEMTQERISMQEKRLNNIDGGIAELIQMSDDQSKQLYGTGSELVKLKKAVERLDTITSRHSAILQKSKK